MTVQKKAGLILILIAVTEGTWVFFNWYINGNRFWKYLGFQSQHTISISAWTLALIVTALYVYFGSRLPSVRSTLIQFSWLKILSVAVAFAAGILEEVVFRKWVMDSLMNRQYGVAMQIICSAILFGLLHGIWGLFGRSFQAFAGATIATAILGLGLGALYIVSDRNLLPCIAAHFMINLFLEPGLVLAACRGEMNSIKNKSVH